jgi:uncharacterized protein (TIGR02996 family)
MLLDHPEYLALLRGVLENPQDVAVRLILSDWLEENGEEDRAEFIRLQCRIATLQADCNCGACVSLRGGGQHHNGPCAVDRDRDELPGGRTKQAFLSMRSQDILGKNWKLWFPFAIPKRPCTFATNGYGHLRVMHGDGEYIGIRCDRGFISEVRLTCREFCGGICEQCRGTGSHGYIRDGYSDNFRLNHCSTCSGSGHTPGVARELFERHPLTRIVLTDKKPSPMQLGDLIGFYGLQDRQYETTTQSRELDSIPNSIALHMTGTHNRVDSVDSWRWYKSESAALSALSDACVAYGRNLAGLPPLK